MPFFAKISDCIAVNESGALAALMQFEGLNMRLSVHIATLGEEIEEILQEVGQQRADLLHKFGVPSNEQPHVLNVPATSQVEYNAHFKSILAQKVEFDCDPLNLLDFPDKLVQALTPGILMRLRPFIEQESLNQVLEAEAARERNRQKKEAH